MRRCKIRCVIVQILVLTANLVWQPSRFANGDTLSSLYTFPAAVTAGTAAELVVSGVPRWPLQVHCRDKDISWQCLEEKGHIRVTAPADTSPRVIWFRLYDDEGASHWLPLGISKTARLAEQEPNDRLEDVAPVELPLIVDGRLGKSDDVDTVAVKLKANEKLVARLTANWLFGSPVDPVLQVADERNNVFIQNHDDRGLDATIVFTAPATGLYYVRCFGFPSQPNTSIRFSGSAAYVYQLELTTGPYIDAWLPVTSFASGSPVSLRRYRPLGWNLPSDADMTVTPSPRAQEFMSDDWEWRGTDGALGWAPLPVHARHIPVIVAGREADSADSLDLVPPVCVAGVVRQESPEHRFRLSSPQGAAWRFRVQSESLGFRLDPWVRIADATGKTIAEFDDTNRQPDLDFLWKAPAEGDYEVILADRFGSTNGRLCYWMAVKEETPGLSVQLPQQHLQAAIGKPLKLKLDVTRRAGWDRPCELRWDGLPDGLDPPRVALTGNKTKESIEVEWVIPGDYGGPKGFPLQVLVCHEGQPIGRVRAGDARPFSPDAEFWVTIGQSK